MRYEMMLPHQIRKAIEENWPVVLPLGVLEYHGEHLAVGMDTLVVVRAAELLEQEMELIILPPFYYGAASYAVAPPENKGTIQVDPDALNRFAKELFRSLLRIGFRNIHIFIHHQSENFVDGMPTDLAWKLAGRQIIFEFLNNERGEGWWGDNQMADYYESLSAQDNPFNWIRVHPFMDTDTQAQYPIDHAGKQESSLMMAFCPEGIDMDRLSEEKWYCAQSKEANIGYGNAAKERILDHMRKALKGA